MSTELTNGIVTFHRTRENWFRIKVTAELNGKRKEVHIGGRHMFNAFRILVGDKLEIKLGCDDG